MTQLREEEKLGCEISTDDLDYLKAIEKATFSGFLKLLDHATLLPVDIASVAKGDVRRIPSSAHHSKTSPTNIALGLLFVILAKDRGYLTRNEAYEHALRMFGAVELLDTCFGFNYNWYYLFGKSGKVPGVTFNRFVSSVDNGNLDTALMAIAAYFSGSVLAERIERFLKTRDYRFFFCKNPKNPKSQMMNLGYDAEKQSFSDSDYSIFNTEGRMLALISILKDQVPEAVWKKQSRIVRRYVTLGGEEIPVVAPWGGSLFEGLFADEVIGGNRIAPKAFWKNAVNLIRIHQDQGRNVSESGIWGFSNGEVPGEDRYEMAGVKEIAYSRFLGEFVTVYSSFLALQYDPKSAIDNLHKIEALNPGSFNSNFGFVDSVDPKTGVINRNVLSLDKGMEWLALGNFLNRMDGKKEIPDYFQDYLKNRLWYSKAENLLKEEEGHPSFQSLFEPDARVKTFRETFPVFILGLEREIRAFKGAVKAKSDFEIVGSEGSRTVCVIYDVREKDSFAGISIAFDKINLEPFSGLVFELKGNKELGMPESLKVELKWKGELIQFEHLPITNEWQRVAVPCPFKPHMLDEIAFVFENASAGKDSCGEIFIQSLAFR